jgi:crotonobetainyl-CoA:carnitine CoA-transferase CaiB-like acyl-CoA transferase
VTALLDGVRVVDLTDAYGALATRVLAELGATVVRVERPGGGGGARRAPVTDEGVGLHHLHRNAGKTIVERDPAVAADRDGVESALAGADLVVVGAAGWGSERGDAYTAHAIATRHPHAVVVSLTPFGLTGPAADWASTELVSQAMAGVVYRSGVPELPPVAAPGSYCEDVGAVTAAMAALLGLHQARDEGAGQVVDVSAVLALAQCTDTALPLWSLLQNDQVRLGAGLYPLFDCRDGLARLVLPMTPGDWRALIAWMGSPPEWTGPEWQKAMLGPDERAQILARLPSMFATRTRDEVAAEGDAAGVRITPVLTPAEVLRNEHVDARRTFLPVDVGNGRTGSLTAGFFGVDGERAAIAGAPQRATDLPRWDARPAASPARPAAGPTTSDRTLPLSGVTVLDFGTGVAAPEAGRVLAEWGADVIKVESRRRIDFQRAVMGGDMNPAFASPNRTKRALGADVSTPEGRALVTRLLPHVDVVLENSATGVMERLGFGWDALSAANPRVVLVSSQLYGNRGPWSWRKGYGPSARAVGGLTWLWAHGPDAPRGVMTIHPDHFAGRLGALGALAGLAARERTGRGCRVDTAQFEAVAGLLGDLLLAESVAPGAAVPVGNRSAEHVPWNLYRAADDDAGAEAWLAVCVTDDDAWRGLCDVAGDALDADDKWRTTAGRVADAERVDEAVAAWVRGQDARSLEEALQAHGVAAAQALHPRIQAAHPHFVARGFAVEVDQPGCGPLLLEGPAFGGTRLGSPRCGPAPLPGEHTVAVCRELLGLDDDEIARLVAAGALDPS